MKWHSIPQHTHTHSSVIIIKKKAALPQTTIAIRDIAIAKAQPEANGMKKKEKRKKKL